MVDGIFNVLKPPVLTSFDTVLRVRRMSNTRRVGHGGTLDPLATGVLPIFVGRATRMVPFFKDSAKIYRAVVEMGKTTSTYDSAGEITGTGNAGGVDREMLERVLAEFRGQIKQVPPMYSAIKMGGKRLYELARAGIQVDRQARTVYIYDLRTISWDFPLLTIEVECSSGTYIRSLAYDIGQSLGCGAYLKNLIRLKCGRFDIEDSITLLELNDAFQNNYWDKLIYPLDYIVPDSPVILAKGEREKNILNGNIDFLGREVIKFNRETGTGTPVRLYTTGGDFMAMLRPPEGSRCWKLEKNLSQGIDKQDRNVLYFK